MRRDEVEGPPLRRRLPRLLIGLALAVICLAGLFRRAIPDVWWGVTHRGTVAYGEERFRVPLGWRPEETAGEEHTIALRNKLREVLWSRGADQIVIREAQSAFDPVEMAQRWERLETRFMIPGDRLEPTPKDAFLREHYRCSDIKRSREGRVSLACFDKEGRWVVSLRGDEQGIADMSAIMRSVSDDVPAGRR